MTVSNYPCVLCRMRLLLLLSTIFLPSSSRFLIETLHHNEFSQESGANNYPGNVETVVEEEGADYAENEDDEETDQRGNEPDKDEQVEEAGADYTEDENDEEKDQIGNEPDKDEQVEKVGADLDQDVVSTAKFPDKMSP